MANRPSSLARIGFGGHRIEFARGRRDGIAGVAETGDIIDVVLALRPAAALRQEVRGAAAHQHIGLRGKKLFDDLVIGAAAAGMRHHRGRRGVLDFGIGDDADAHVEPPLRKAGDGFDLGVVERIGGAVRIDAHRVDGGLVAGGVGARGVGRIGDDRIRAGGRHQRHVRHVVDGELAEALALRDALGQQPRGGAMRRRHAVTDEQDHVLRLARPGVVDRPRQLAAARAIADFDRDAAGLCQ